LLILKSASGFHFDTNKKNMKHFPNALLPLLPGILFFLSLVSKPLCVQAQSTTYYVDYDNGSDSNPGTSEILAWKNISFAVGSSSPVVAGNTIMVKERANGLAYPTHNTIRITGSNGNYITIKAYPGHNPIIHPGTGSANCFSGGIDISYFIIEGFECTGVEDANAVGIGFYGVDTDHIEIRDVYIHDIGLTFPTNANPAIYFGGSATHQNNIIEDCTIDNISGEGIYIGSSSSGNFSLKSHHFTIENNSITDCKDEAVDIKPNAHDILISDNNFEDCGHSYSGIRLDGQFVEFANNTLRNMGNTTGNSFAISFSDGKYDGHNIHHNYFFNTLSGGGWADAHIKFPGDAVGTPFQITHNTFIGAGKYGLFFYEETGNHIVKDNIFINSTSHQIKKHNSNGNTMDYNAYDIVDIDWDDIDYSDLAVFCSNESQECNGFSGTLLVDLSDGSLLEGSPLKNAASDGTHIGAWQESPPPSSYTLSVSSNGNGTVTLDPPGGTYNVGSQVTLTATADAINQFIYWSGDNISVTNPLTVTVNSDMNIAGNFRPTDVCEIRGTWLNPKSFDSQLRRTATLTKLTTANFNTIFVAAPPIGDNYGWSDASHFLAFIQQADLLGFSVHVWVSNNNRIEDVDFTSPAEQAAQAQWVLDLMAQYGTYLDGVHFDYIRYSDWEDVNIDGKMDGVTQTIANAYTQLKLNYPDKYLTCTSFDIEPNWEESYVDPPLWGEDVPTWFKNWYAANPGSIFHGGVVQGLNYVGVPHHMKYQQNPVEWISGNICDGVMPMQYTMDQSPWEEEAGFWKDFLQFVNSDFQKTFMGIGWLSEDGHPDWGYDAAGVVNKINYGRSIGLKGFVVFQIGAIDDGNGNHIDDMPLINALANGPCQTPALSCFTSGIVSPYKWSGAIGTDWGTGGNWQCGNAPTSTDNVVIPDVANYLIIGEAPGTPAICNNLTINSGATLAIDAGKALSVKGDLTIAASKVAATLTVNSDATGTGSLIVSGTSTGNIIFKRYVDEHAKAATWHYVSSPVAGQSLGGTWMDDNDIAFNDPARQFYRFDEDTDYWIYYGYTGSVPEDFGDNTFVEARGYCITRSGAGELSFTGTVRTSDVTYATTYTSDKGEGCNLVGNPFTSSLGVTNSASTTSNFLAVNSDLLDNSYEALYIWDEQTGYSGGRNDYKIIYNGAVVAGVIDQDYIQPGQAFMVKIVSGGGNLAFNEDMQAHATVDFYKNTKELWPSVELIVENNDLYNSTAIGFNENMTLGLDPSYDVGKMKGNPDIALYTKLVEDNGVDFAIQALPFSGMEEFEIAVGVDVLETTILEFSANQEKLDNYNIVLEDRQENTFTNLRWDTYFAEINGNGTGRFFLHFKDATAIGETMPQSSISCRYINGKLLVQNLENETGWITLANVSGQVLGRMEMDSDETQVFSIHQPTGIYIISVQTGKTSISKKIFIN